LILSHDLTNSTIMDKVWPVISNKEALAVNQAWDGFSGSVFQGTTSTFQFWNKPVGGGKVAVLLMNHAATSATLTLSLASVPGITGSSWLVRDIWARKDVGAASGSFTVPQVASHDSAFLMLTCA
jgi:alpha-galactosidase